jgi:tRNA-2-methylthio-N6-dimethylallyladenosine synthase
MTGRTPCDRIVVWDGNERQAGELLDILIHDASATTLFGSVETRDVPTDVFLPTLTLQS